MSTPRQYRLVIMGEWHAIPNGVEQALVGKSRATRPWNRALRIMDRLRRSYGQTMVFVERAR